MLGCEHIPKRFITSAFEGLDFAMGLGCLVGLYFTHQLIRFLRDINSRMLSISY